MSHTKAYNSNDYVSQSDHLDGDSPARQPPAKTGSTGFWESQGSGYNSEYWNHDLPSHSLPPFYAPSRGYYDPHLPASSSDHYTPIYSGDPTDSGHESWNHSGTAPDTKSTCSKDSGYESAPSSREFIYGMPHSGHDIFSAYNGVRSVQGKFDCPGKGCGRTGEHGFFRKDHLREHLKKVHAKEIPEVAITVQVAPEPGIAQQKSISQGASPTNRLGISTTKRRPSSIFANAELSTMTKTEEHEVRDAVKPAKIVSEPDDEARSSTLDHPIHTTPLTVMDAVDELKSGISDDGSEHAQDGDDGSLVDGPLCFRLACLYYLIELTPFCKRLLERSRSV